MGDRITPGYGPVRISAFCAAIALERQGLGCKQTLSTNYLLSTFRHKVLKTLSESSWNPCLPLSWAPPPPFFIGCQFSSAVLFPQFFMNLKCRESGDPGFPAFRTLINYLCFYSYEAVQVILLKTDHIQSVSPQISLPS